MGSRKRKNKNINTMKTLKIAFVGLCLLLTCQLQSQVTSGSQTEELKTKILNELRNEKLIYYFNEKVIPKKQTNGEASGTEYSIRRMYANKKPKENGGIDAIFFSHDTLCFTVNDYIIHENSYTNPRPPKGDKAEAKIIYVPVGLQDLIYQHGDSEWGGHDVIFLKDIQIIYTGIKFNFSPKEIEERVKQAKALYKMLLTYQRGLDLHLLDLAIEKFKAEANSYKKRGVAATIPEEQRKLIVQANAANDEKQYKAALDLYNQALKMNKFSYPNAYYNMALISAATNDFLGAIYEIKQYRVLVPPDTETARKIQDKIYEWEYKLNQDLAPDKP
jgi:tetratricopeptide (TPR) repeat protein